MTERSSILMQMDLTSHDSCNADWPIGVQLIAFNPEQHAREARSLLNLAYSSGGGEVIDFENWWPALKADPEYDRNLCFPVFDIESGRMAAFAQCWTTGFVKDIAVSNELRRTGIGRALMRHISQAFYTRGRTKVSLKVQTDNPSGAVEFYTSLGMEAAKPPIGD